MKDDPRESVPDSELRHIASLTALIRQKQAEMQSLADRRREEVLRLAHGSETKQRVSYERLAKAMGVTEVAVYKMMRGNGPRLRDRKPATKLGKKPLPK